MMTYYHLSSSSLSLTRTSAVASLPNNHSEPPPPRHIDKTSSPKVTPPRRITTNRNPIPPKQKPTIIQIERAIGAGMFHDTDPKDLELRKSVLGGVLPNFSRKFESPVERTLRGFGEQIATQTESKSNSSENRILMFAIKWVLPTWIVLLLVACGVVKLPFSIPYVDELIM